MKLTIAWNVWNNYQDTLLGSEIARIGNEESRCFSNLYLISQGGYPEGPSERDARYLDGHFRIGINEDNELVRLHPKFKGVFRVLVGIQHAYRYALEHGCDYVLVTNADAWCLSLERLKALLNRKEVQNSAISARIGLCAGLDLSYGAYVPFFDDHFLILNTSLCRAHRVFEYDEPKAFRAHFSTYGGIHYMLAAFVDERVPPGLFHAYTHMEDCVNHYGEKSGYSLLPWQYQPSLGFLHANCAQEPDLHPLRAQMLRRHRLDRYPAVQIYCDKHAGNEPFFASTDDYVYYRQSLTEKAQVGLMTWPLQLYYDALRALRYSRYARIKRSLCHFGADTLDCYDRYRAVLPLALASRRKGGRQAGDLADKADG